MPNYLTMGGGVGLEPNAKKRPRAQFYFPFSFYAAIFKFIVKNVNVNSFQV
jgi:hypothetical protein